MDGVAGSLGKARLERRGGRVHCSAGRLLTCHDLGTEIGIGDICRVERGGGGGPREAPFDERSAFMAEVVGFDGRAASLLPYEEIDGVGPGARAYVDRCAQALRPDRSWLGRVLDALGRPLDGGPPLALGPRAYPIQAAPPAAHRRQLVGGRLMLGVRALDLFTPCCAGQRMGIFAGSGVGKSTLSSMLARGAEADVLVVGLIGERGREVNELLTRTLDSSGRARSVVVVATSDMPAMMRRRGAYVTLTVAEHFRDQGLRVLCLLDSVTRFAMALREIHLAAGQPPTTKGYPPGVFAELPRLLERAGPGEGKGSITGLFTVLVEGDDTNEPIADSVRGILDGHILLDRQIAEAGRFPAIDVLRSVSRTAPGCYTADERRLVGEARRLMAAHAAMAELIQVGAYRSGADPLTDRAITLRPQLERLLAQAPDDPPDSGSPFEHLARVVGAAEATAP
jgi:flagellum-specific ATP synthase